MTYHKAGRKIIKVGWGTQNPEMDEQIIQELKLREDIIHAFDIYAIDNLVTEVEIEEVLRVISDICKSFRHLHIDLTMRHCMLKNLVNLPVICTENGRRLKP